MTMARWCTWCRWSTLRLSLLAAACCALASPSAWPYPLASPQWNSFAPAVSLGPSPALAPQANLSGPQLFFPFADVHFSAGSRVMYTAAYGQLAAWDPAGSVLWTTGVPRWAGYEAGGNGSSADFVVAGNAVVVRPDRTLYATSSWRFLSNPLQSHASVRLVNADSGAEMCRMERLQSDAATPNETVAHWLSAQVGVHVTLQLS